MHNESEELANIRHLERIAKVMTPDPSEWFFDGEVVDLGGMAGRCSCGHPIRYEFIVRHPDGRTAPIGSVCIESSVPWLIEMGAEALAKTLEQALEQHEEAKKEALKRLRDAQNAVEAAELEQFWNEQIVPWFTETKRAYKEATGNAHTGYCWYPDWMYKGLEPMKQLSTPGRTASALRSRIATMARNAMDGNYDGFPALPEDKKLRERVNKKLTEEIEGARKKVEWYAKKLEEDPTSTMAEFYKTRLEDSLAANEANEFKVNTFLSKVMPE